MPQEPSPQPAAGRREETRLILKGKLKVTAVSYKPKPPTAKDLLMPTANRAPPLGRAALPAAPGEAGDLSHVSLAAMSPSGL